MSYIEIANSSLSASINTLGGTIHSLQLDGVEYFWQGSEKYWPRQDLNLFPYVGRLTEECYTLQGQRYSMGIHGFARGMEFEVTEHTATSVTLSIHDTEETRAAFPFSFTFTICYKLSGSSLVKTVEVKNLSSSTMHFGLGGHPGFNIPINGEGDFTDWYIEFAQSAEPSRILFHPVSYRLSGQEVPYPLQDGTKIPLRHDLFDNDAIVLKNMPRSLTLRSDRSARSVTVSFPQTPFVGFWHTVKSDAPFVCVEPWVSLPSHHDYIEDFETQPDLISLPAGMTYSNEMTIALH